MLGSSGTARHTPPMVPLVFGIGLLCSTQSHRCCFKQAYAIKQGGMLAIFVFTLKTWLNAAQIFDFTFFLFFVFLFDSNPCFLFLFLFLFLFPPTPTPNGCAMQIVCGYSYTHTFFKPYVKHLVHVLTHEVNIPKRIRLSSCHVIHVQ